MEGPKSHQGVNTNRRAHSFFSSWIRQREIGQRLALGHSDAFYKSLYSSISPCDYRRESLNWDIGNALFSLDFSQDGKLLVAGCLDGNLRMFDPLSRRLIHTSLKAHRGRVTHVNFLDSQNFATGSVDTKVSLWDTRYLKKRILSLMHSDSITNVEFSRKHKYIITSGYGGIIYIWDMKNLQRRWRFNLFLPHFLQRLRINPDETKMVISTRNGSLLTVHDLDFATIAHDVDEFVLEMIDFESLLPAYSMSGWHSSRFLLPKRRRNRVEIVDDFLKAGEFNTFYALEIHPQGCSVLSRSRRGQSGIEWTCVHDLAERKFSKRGATLQGESGIECSSSLMQDDSRRKKQNGLQKINEEPVGESGSGEGIANLRRASGKFNIPSSNDSGSPADIVQAWSPSSGPSYLPSHPLEVDDLGDNKASFQAQDLSLPRPNPIFSRLKRRVHVQFPRLSHFIDEPRISERYISSLGVSADGRLLCSPFDCGIRLLAFSTECSEQAVSWNRKHPASLCELSRQTCHNLPVLCTKFSPCHCLLVSGGLDGKLAWYQPVV